MNLNFPWISDRAQRRGRLRRFRSYWLWRRRLNSVQFWAYWRVLDVRRSARERRVAVGVAGAIARTVATSILAAVVIAIALELLDRHVLQDSGLLRRLLPDDSADRVVRRFADGPDADRELSLLSTIGQIAGVFLALYFTAVSAIAATVYANVPGDVRLLVTREKAGNVYIKTVAFLGAYALILASAVVLDIRVGVLNIACVGLLSALSIFAFVVLGFRTFNFFSPDTLVGYVNADLVPLIDGSRRGAFGIDNRAIPYNYQRRAEDLLSTLRAVVGLSVTRPSVTERSLLQIVAAVLRLLYYYESRKSDIPTDSLWFKRRLEHPKWLTSDSTSVGMALQTQTAIQGKEVPDRDWFERLLHDVLRVLLEALLARADRVRAVEAVMSIVSWTRPLAHELAIDETLSLTKLAQDVVEAHLTGRPSADRSVESLALADAAAALPMQIVLGMSERLRPLDGPQLATQTGAVDPLGLLKEGWPRQIVEQREDLAARLNSERLVERRRLTADWYIAQLNALAMSRFFAAAVPELVGELAMLPERAENLLAGGQPVLGAATVQRGIECCHKFAVHLREFEACLARLSDLRRAQDIPWAETDWKGAQEKVAETRTNLLALTARVSVEMSDIDTGGEIPDYFGATYAFLADECFATMVGGAAAFEKLYPAFFLASLNAHERLKRELINYDQQTQILFSTETIDDLLDISGYALLLKEIGQDQYWRVVKQLWDKYLEGHDRAQFFTFLFAVLSFRGAMFLIKPRDIGRTSWQMAFRRHIAELGLGGQRYPDPFDYDDEDEEFERATPLFRATVRGMMGRDAGQAFTAGYLLTWPEAQGLDLPRDTEVFLETLEFEEEKEGRRRAREPEVERQKDVGDDQSTDTKRDDPEADGAGDGEQQGRPERGKDAQA